MGRRWSFSVLVYTGFILLPIYWLAVLSLQPNHVSKSTLNLIPTPLTFENYAYILSQQNWTMGYLNALIYVGINLCLTLAVSVPAAYSFARFRFIGRDQAFFFAFMLRVIPPAILIVPLVQLFSAMGMIDTYLAVALAHCIFSVPIAIWILEGFISAIPKELDEMAAADGYGPLGYVFRILLPQLRTGLGVSAFFSFMFSWVELTIANTLTTVNTKPIGVVMRIVAEPLGQVHVGIASAASILMLLPGLVLVWFLRRHLAHGFSLGRVN